ncbi:D-2-hydroxyacid dehydrogenase [Nioella sediminis]|uniref:D-2-hydroxyacid dehydrogenase n=1 Tax=Nioella sediminis TaxID=1912092 RepID=UPI0008FCFEBD|nr:D-2-hydroxyacid dehydrogenase [Nioella sediminis]
MTRIALCLDLNGAQIARLRAGIGEAELEETGDLDGCEIAFGNPPPEALAEAGTLKWVQLESVGFGEYADLDWTLLGQRLTLTNLAGFFADPVAETALAGLLALARGVDRLARLQASRTWEGDPIRTRLRLLKGARVVMLGNGAINRRLAELLAPFGCEITALDSSATTADLDALLPTADILVATVPDTPATRGLLSAERLALLPRHAVLANLGRGSLIDEDALADALADGRLAGAVLDVTRDEPLPPDHRFWTCPNILLTQHSGGGTADELDRKIDTFLANLARYRAGQPLQGVVDMTRGY